MELMPGYKQTQVGVIPEDWEIHSGEDITTLIGKGASPRWQGFGYTDSGMLFITSENVRDGFLDIREPKYLPLAFHEKLKRTKLRKYDILINLVGASIGRSCLIPTDLGEANVNQAVGVFRVKDEISSRYIACAFQAFPTIKRILEMQVDAARQNISLSNLRSFMIAVPSLAEQEAIAEAVSDADAIIESLGQLVAKKRQIKHGAMQELLTGKRRLPGFNGKWQVKRLGDCLLGHPQYGINAPAVPYSDRLPTYIRITDITEYGRFESSPRVSVNSLYAHQYFLSDGDLVFARTGASVGKSYRYDIRDGQLVFAGFLIRVRPDPHVLHPDFLAAFATTVPYWNWVRLMSMRSGQPGINGNEYAQLPIKVPDAVEQTAIVAILSDMDAEITALEAKLAKARQIKQGMMQELLTGRIRLV